MKKTDSIQLVVIIVALMMAYKALEIVPYFIWVFYRWFMNGLTMGEQFYSVGINFLYLLFYTVVSVVLIRRSKILSQKIAAAAAINPELNLYLKRNDIIYAAFIITGSYILATKLPKLLIKIYAHIKDINTPFGNDGPNFIMPQETIAELLIICILGSVMLVYAGTLTEYITRNIKEENHDIETIGSADEK